MPPPHAAPPPPPAAAAALSGAPQRAAAAYVSLYSEAIHRYLAVSPSDGWLRAAPDDATPLSERAFEVSSVGPAAGGGVWVSLKALSNGRYVELVPPNEQLAWVYRANGVELSQRHHFQLQEGGCVRHAPRGPRTNRARAPLCSVS